MKKHLPQSHQAISSKLKYLLPALIFSLVFFGTVTAVQNQNSTRVLGEQTEQKGNQENKEGTEPKEQVEQAEPTEAPEPTETPEQEQEHEQEAEKIHQEVQKEIQNNNVDKVELHPTSEKPGEGTLKIEKVNGSSTEKTVPSSVASLISIQNSQAGSVSISVSKNGTVTLVNGGITVQTNYPVVIDPQTQTIAIKTTNGVTVINSLPSQALNGVQPIDKPTTIQSAVLGTQNGQAYYDVKGVQQRRFVGLVPIKANVETKIDAQNGSTISVNKPWYLNIFGFLYSI
ncbi:MAG: hypothetical protein M1575_01110 [Patescibacteria group bacterium]|nr:hypothetical protein [Patescibacteria group bacterium]MCL5095318.1 hypothetical protein [Patescibacteria group bacterium]